MLRIFILAEFDPAGVCMLHRDALRVYAKEKGLDVDIRMAMQTAYTPFQHKADWLFAVLKDYDFKKGTYIFDKKEAPQEMLDFAHQADVIQTCPAIGQPWASDPYTGPGSEEDVPKARYFNMSWSKLFETHKKKVAFFHGGKSAWTFRKAYKKHFLDLGYKLATSTLDYGVELDAKYLPPSIHKVHGRAPLRQEDDPLIVAHTPSDPGNCHSEIFQKLCRQYGIVVRYVYQRSWEESMHAKLSAHACFDHLRGSFSVNTLEGMTVGCVPLVGITKECRALLEKEGFGTFPSLEVYDAKSLQNALTTLDIDTDLTREFQEKAFAWVHEHYSQMKIGERMWRFYNDVAA